MQRVIWLLPLALIAVACGGQSEAPFFDAAAGHVGVSHGSAGSGSGGASSALVGGVAGHVSASGKAGAAGVVSGSGGAVEVVAAGAGAGGALEVAVSAGSAGDAAGGSEAGGSSGAGVGGAAGGIGGFGGVAGSGGSSAAGQFGAGGSQAVGYGKIVLTWTVGGVAYDAGAHKICSVVNENDQVVSGTAAVTLAFGYKKPLDKGGSSSCANVDLTIQDVPEGQLLMLARMSRATKKIPGGTLWDESKSPTVEFSAVIAADKTTRISIDFPATGTDGAVATVLPPG